TVGLEAPGDLELVEVVAGDLIERRVAGAVEIGAVVRPFAVARARLAGGRLREDARRRPQERDGAPRNESDEDGVDGRADGSSRHRNPPAEEGQLHVRVILP